MSSAPQILKLSDATHVFVSAVKGAAVGRLGSGTATKKNVAIGCRFEPAPNGRGKGRLVWNEQEIVAIPLAEWNAHHRHYARALKRGELKKRSAEDYAKWASEQLQASIEQGKARAAQKAKPEAGGGEGSEPEAGGGETNTGGAGRGKRRK